MPRFQPKDPIAGFRNAAKEVLTLFPVSFDWEFVSSSDKKLAKTAKNASADKKIETIYKKFRRKFVKNFDVLLINLKDLKERRRKG